MARSALSSERSLTVVCYISTERRGSYVTVVLDLRPWCDSTAEQKYIITALFCRPQFRFTDHIAALDDDQPKKMLLKRDPDSCEVSHVRAVTC